MIQALMDRRRNPDDIQKRAVTGGKLGIITGSRGGSGRGLGSGFRPSFDIGKYMAQKPQRDKEKVGVETEITLQELCPTVRLAGRVPCNVRQAARPQRSRARQAQVVERHRTFAPQIEVRRIKCEMKVILIPPTLSTGYRFTSARPTCSHPASLPSKIILTSPSPRTPT